MRSTKAQTTNASLLDINSSDLFRFSLLKPKRRISSADCLTDCRPLPYSSTPIPLVHLLYSTVSIRRRSFRYACKLQRHRPFRVRSSPLSTNFPEGEEITLIRRETTKPSHKPQQNSIILSAHIHIHLSQLINSFLRSRSSLISPRYQYSRIAHPQSRDLSPGEGTIVSLPSCSVTGIADNESTPPHNRQPAASTTDETFYLLSEITSDRVTRPTSLKSLACLSKYTTLRCSLPPSPKFEKKLPQFEIIEETQNPPNWRNHAPHPSAPIPSRPLLHLFLPAHSPKSTPIPQRRDITPGGRVERTVML